jgi:hypothetical protein
MGMAQAVFGKGRLCQSKINSTPGMATAATTGLANTRDKDSAFNNQNAGLRIGRATKPV